MVCMKKFLLAMSLFAGFGAFAQNVPTKDALTKAKGELMGMLEAMALAEGAPVQEVAKMKRLLGEAEKKCANNKGVIDSFHHELYRALGVLEQEEGALDINKALVELQSNRELQKSVIKVGMFVLDDYYNCLCDETNNSCVERAGALGINIFAEAAVKYGERIVNVVEKVR